MDGLTDEELLRLFGHEGGSLAEADAAEAEARCYLLQGRQWPLVELLHPCQQCGLAVIDVDFQDGRRHCERDDKRGSYEVNWPNGSRSHLPGMWRVHECELGESTSTRTPESTGDQSPPEPTERAAKLAAVLGVDLATVKGTGRRGRITVEDVRRTKWGRHDDLAPSTAELLGERPMRPPPETEPRCNRTCNRCDRANLAWAKLNDGWRLFELADDGSDPGGYLLAWGGTEWSAVLGSPLPFGPRSSHRWKLHACSSRAPVTA